jgi:group I intron endonuclease
MQIKKSYKNVICIYCIENKITGKKYIGKSINLQSRLAQHRYLLGKEIISGGTNPHLYASWKKHGIKNFNVSILEQFKVNIPEVLADREVFWITFLDTLNPKKGYNMMLHYSPTKIITEDSKKLQRVNKLGEKNPNFGRRWSEEKKKSMSNLKKKMYLLGEHGKADIDVIKANFKKVRDDFAKHPEKLKDSIRKQSKTRTKYHIYQYDRNMKLIKIWETIYELLENNPTYKRHNIYAVCSGEKPTMYNFIWKKIKIDDIVRS